MKIPCCHNTLIRPHNAGLFCCVVGGGTGWGGGVGGGYVWICVDILKLKTAGTFPLSY